MFPRVVIEKDGGFVPVDYDVFVLSLIKKFDDPKLELAHTAMGISGESGEYTDAIKKHIIYGKDLDKNNVREELGDLLFFIQDAMNKHSFTWEEVLQANADKLAKRYKEIVYSDEAALERADKKPEEIKSHHEVRIQFNSNIITSSEWMQGDGINYYVYADSRAAVAASLHIAGPYESMHEALKVIPLQCNLLWRVNSQTGKIGTYHDK